MIDFKNDTGLTLFLDRDGVINHQIEDGYILNPDEFIFYTGVEKAIATLSNIFKYIFVVTNQRGVGRGLMTLQDLRNIHDRMKKNIEYAGGRIDRIYHCTDTDAGSPCRKPNPGMALQAKKDFPDLDFSKSVMVGNSFSDMEFGRNIGATTVFLTTTKYVADHSDSRIDAVYRSLADFANAIGAHR